MPIAYMKSVCADSTRSGPYLRQVPVHITGDAKQLPPYDGTGPRKVRRSSFGNVLSTNSGKAYRVDKGAVKAWIAFTSHIRKWGMTCIIKGNDVRRICTKLHTTALQLADSAEW
jgi:hypothetical protein